MNVLWYRPVPNCVCFLRIHPNLAIPNDMTKVFDRRHLKLTFLWLKIELVVLEDAHDFLDYLSMAMLVSREDKDVV